MQEMRVRSLGREDPLEEEMATHSSIFTWEIPWAEELVGYSRWGRKELGHILGTKQWPLRKDLSLRKWPQSRLLLPPSPGSTSPQKLPSPRAQPTTR